MSTIRLCAALVVAAAAGMGQSYDFDNSGNGTLQGPYFVREVTLLNLSAQGAVGNAFGAIGIATFDGAGNYTFSGQLTGTGSVSSTGTYAVASNGFLRIASFASQGATAFGGVGKTGPNAFTASATDNSTPVFDLMVGIPIGASVSNSNVNGAYNAVYLNFPQAAVGKTRQAYMPLTADGAGGFGAVTATGSATDNASLTTQAVPSVTYSLSGSTGTINFGAAAANQLIGGTESFFVSADGNLLVGGSPNGYDLLLASPAASSVTNSGFKGFYFLGGLDADNTMWTSQGRSLPDAYYGSANSNGQGTYFGHLRLNSNGFPTEDLTSAWSSAIQGSGSFTPGDGDQYWLSAGGAVLLGVGQGNFYSIMAGLQATSYMPPTPATPVTAPTPVFLNPLGIVNAASFSPATNPVAPQEMVTLSGSNLSSVTAQAPAWAMPISLGGTRVLVNGIASALLAVSPTQVTMLVPSHVSPDFTAYASFEVQNTAVPCVPPTPTLCSVTSNLVTMYTNYTAPGVFSLSGNGFGPAAAELYPGYTAIGPSRPAQPGDLAILFATGMGSVAPSLADGAPSSPSGNPTNVLNIYDGSSLYVYIDGYVSPNLQFAGVVPGFAAGFDQINAFIPAGISNGNEYVDILTPDAEAEQVTVNIADASGAAIFRSSGAAALRPSGRGRRHVRSGPIIAPPASRLPR